MTMHKNNQDFEKQLHSAFKKYSYLFPTTEEELQHFEKLYGTTDIEMPEKFKNSEVILAKLNSTATANHVEDSAYAMAARGGKKLTTELINKMRADRTDATQKAKRKSSKK